MPNITSFEMLKEEIERAVGWPSELEALWDGDGIYYGRTYDELCIK